MMATIFPFPDKTVVRKISGHIFKEVLENAIALYPNYSGRWPHISGAKFVFDSEKPQGQRIISLTNIDNSEFCLDK
jgi:2',3'-cyclic-nucleotide 2'-phosphodiesterase (5'-nucleotidase family)